MLRLDSRVCRRRDVSWRMIEGEAVLVDADEGELIRLSESGAEIWKLIDGHMTVKDIIERINENFEADRRIIERDVRDFLRRLIRMEIIKLRGR